MQNWDWLNWIAIGACGMAAIYFLTIGNIPLFLMELGFIAVNLCAINL